MTSPLPSLPEAKAEARDLRRHRAAAGHTIGHARSLELVARSYGFRDWNAFHAAIADRPPAIFTVRGRVSGTYLSQPFTATITSVAQERPGWFRLWLDLDAPVDVVRSEAFSNRRSRVQCVVGPAGTTREMTSDGVPHVVIKL